MIGRRFGWAGRIAFALAATLITTLVGPAQQGATLSIWGNEKVFGDYLLPRADTHLLADTQPKGVALKSPGVYQIDVLPITSSRGTPNVTKENSKVVIDKVSGAYEAMSNGTIKFVLRNVLPAVVGPDDLISPREVEGLLSSPLKADDGYNGVLLVGVIVPKTSLGYAGIAVYGGAVLTINVTWSTTEPSLPTVLAHEVGHTLGLGHSGYSTCNQESQLLKCTVASYGDDSDFMGGASLGYVTNPPSLRVSAWHLRQLKLLPTEASQVISTSGTFDLAPVYSGAGKRLLVIPVYGAPGYAIEYRPAIGIDALLSQTQLPIPGSRSYYTNIPSHGVQIRVLQSNSSTERPWLPYAPSAGTAVSVLSPSPSLQGLQVGQSFSLPDGSVVRVLSSDPTRGAQVSITTPADQVAPSMPKATLGWGYSDRDEEVIMDREWSEIRFYSSEVKEDRMIATAALLVNGVEVIKKELIEESSFTLDYTPEKVGSFQVKAIVKDLAGNEFVLERTIRSRMYQHPPSEVFFTLGKPSKSVVELWYPDLPGWTFTVSQISAGKPSAPRKVRQYGETWNVITIKNLKPGQTVSAKVLGVDEFGQTDGGQTVRKKTTTR